MILTLDAKRRLTVPSALAPASPGDAFEAIYDQEEDEILLRRVKRKSDWLEVWSQCPVPMDDLAPVDLPQRVGLRGTARDLPA